MANIDKVKILVIGDSGVGKSSLVNLICYQQPISNPSSTIGCSAEVKLHDFNAGTRDQRTYFVELWDVGGSQGHWKSRSVCYSGAQGIILVHDLSNRKSQLNLRRWLAEALSGRVREVNASASEADNLEIVVGPGSGISGSGEMAGSQSGSSWGGGLPVATLVVGTRLDYTRETVGVQGSSIAEEYGLEEVTLDCTNPRHLTPGSTNALRISRFFDRVISSTFASTPARGAGGGGLLTGGTASGYYGGTERKRGSLYGGPSIPIGKFHAH